MLREPVGDGGREAYTTIAWGESMSCERLNIAGAETFSDVEGNMCGAVMRGADALPRSKTSSRANRQRWYLGGLMSGPAACAARVRVGGRLLRNRLEKARSRSR